MTLPDHPTSRAELDVRVYADPGALASAIAEASVTVIADAIRSRGRCAIALAGGDTPRALYTHWATTHRQAIDWGRVHLFWGDERVVPPDDPRSNFRMVSETLLQHVPCPASNIHPMSGGASDPAVAAALYSKEVTRVLTDERDRVGSTPVLDLVLLGVGVEGHTASIFPGSPALAADAPLVMAVETPADPPRRLTLTMPVLVAARRVFVLATGTAKARVLELTLSPKKTPEVFPVAALRAAGARVTWWLDRDAAARLDATRVT